MEAELNINYWTKRQICMWWVQNAMIINILGSHLLQMQSEEPKSFIEKFSFILNQYLQALGGIVPIFNYMVGHG